LVVRPIDMQVLVGKLYDVGRLQQQEDQASLVSHQAFASEFKERTEREKTQVQATQRSESQRVEEDKRGGGGAYTPLRKRPPRREKGSPSGVKDPVKGKFLDITF